MERKEIIEKIRIILVTVLKHDEFEMREDLTAAAVAGWDSLSHMMIVTEIENEFNIRFKLKELNKLENLHSLIDLVQSKL
ncbi:MAG TPA: acyl carrier protein [Puia sp.]|jgi:acyl carrier protein